MKNKNSDLINEFKNLRDLLTADGDDNWVRGIDLIIRSLAANEPDAIKKAFQTYTSMSIGKESFSIAAKKP